MECQHKGLQAVKDEVIKRRKAHEDEIDAELDLPITSNEENQSSKEANEQQPQNDNKGLQKSRSFGNTERAKETIKSQLPVSGMTGKRGDPVISAISTQGQLERIRIPIFSGNKWIFRSGTLRLPVVWTRPHYCPS